MLTYFRLYLVTLFLFKAVGCSLAAKTISYQDSPKSLRGAPTSHYSIKWDQSQPKLLQITGTTTLSQGKLVMAHGAEHMPNGWANFIEGLTVKTLGGKSISVHKGEGAEWKVDAAVGQQVQFAYEFHLEHEAYDWSGGLDGVAYTTDWGNFYAGRTVFVHNGTEEQQIEITFDIPSPYKITHPWQSKENNDHAYVLENLSELTQSMFFIGEHEEFKFKEEGFELIFALGGERVVSEMKSYKDMAKGVMDYYTQLMGGLPKAGPNNAVIRSVVIVNEATLTDGEVLGNNISIMIKGDASPMDTMLARFIFAHEFFHLWNGKSIRPTNDQTEWFKEGFSNYYTLKSLQNTGFLDKQGFLDVMNSLFYQRYASDNGIGKIAMTQGAEKHDHWGIIYAGGMFAAMAQDVMIRVNSHNAHSLDDLMQGLYTTYSGSSKAYTLDELEARLSKLNGIDQSDFFNEYIKGSTLFPIEAYLAKGPFKAQVIDGTLTIQPKTNPSPLENDILSGFFGELQSAD